ncbi:hypothetical protein BaRGS_00017340 [Batillaria attramentaria]|uniref:Uncharacterized protein n=1 Tax=Batillaria attramentaria TaxID=370345 RepID=A0ABD0KWV3_9CAEN
MPLSTFYRFSFRGVMPLATFVQALTGVNKRTTSSRTAPLDYKSIQELFGSLYALHGNANIQLVSAGLSVLENHIQAACSHSGSLEKDYTR